ncbi:MAG TPA: DUF3047 domain-containing protein [Verrucomicrobiae bacterium]
MRVISFALIWSGLLCAWSVPAADHQVVGDFSAGTNPKGVPNGWELKEKTGRADLSVMKSDGVHAVQLRSADTSFSLQRQIQVDVKQYPILTWKWKVNKLPVGGDFRKTKTDDQAAQLFVAFSRTRAIVYIWDTSAPQGLMADAPSPPFMAIKAVVVRSGPGDLGQWLAEKRNVYEDYQKFFGAAEKAPVASGLRIQINTQHTRTSGESYFAEVKFEAPAAKEDASNKLAPHGLATTTASAF